MWILNRCSSGSLRSATNPGAGSALITARGPSRGTSGMQRETMASRRALCDSFATKHATEYDVTHSRRINIIWRAWRMTSVANVTPRASGGSSLDCSTRYLGAVRREVHWWHAAVVHCIAWSMSRAMKYLVMTFLSRCYVGWESLRCMAVSKPSRTCRGTTMHSRAAAKGWSQRTIRRPSRPIVHTFK